MTREVDMNGSLKCRQSYWSDDFQVFWDGKWPLGQQKQDVGTTLAHFTFQLDMANLLANTSSSYGTTLAFIWSGVSGHMANVSPKTA